MKRWSSPAKYINFDKYDIFEKNLQKQKISHVNENAQFAIFCKKGVKLMHVLAVNVGHIITQST